LAWKG